MLLCLAIFALPIDARAQSDPQSILPLMQTPHGFTIRYHVTVTSLVPKEIRERQLNDKIESYEKRVAKGELTTEMKATLIEKAKKRYGDTNEYEVVISNRNGWTYYDQGDVRIISDGKHSLVLGVDDFLTYNETIFCNYCYQGSYALPLVYGYSSLPIIDKVLKAEDLAKPSQDPSHEGTIADTLIRPGQGNSVLGGIINLDREHPYPGSIEYRLKNGKPQVLSAKVDVGRWPAYMNWMAPQETWTFSEHKLFDGTWIATKIVQKKCGGYSGSSQDAQREYDVTELNENPLEPSYFTFEHWLKAGEHIHCDNSPKQNTEIVFDPQKGTLLEEAIK